MAESNRPTEKCDKCGFPNDDKHHVVNQAGTARGCVYSVYTQSADQCNGLCSGNRDFGTWVPNMTCPAHGIAARTSNPWDKASEAYCDGDVLMFLGWLSGEFPELHAVEVPRLVSAWERFTALRRPEKATAQRIDYDCPDCGRPVVLGDSICPVTKKQHEPLSAQKTSGECVWTRMPDDPDPLSLMRVQYKAGCRDDSIARGRYAYYPDNCPHCEKPVRVEPAVPRNEVR